MFNNINFKDTLENFSSLYLVILIIIILTSLFFQLLSILPTRLNDFLLSRSRFNIAIIKHLNKYKVEIIILTFIILFIFNYFFNYTQNILITLLSLVLVIFGSIEIIKIIKTEKRIRRQLEQLDKRKSDFLANIAHKLKTPLAIARSNIDLTQIEIEDQQYVEAKKTMARSVQSVDRLARLCTNLITIGKIDFGISQFHKKDLDFSKLVQKTVNDFKVILGDRKLKTDIKPNIKFFGDSDRLQEMILNLLDNAVKFTDEKKGVITVYLKTVKKDSRFENSSIILTISDNGSGIAKDHLPKLFDRYYQVENKSGSAGIGLAICQWIIEGHNGKIEIKSEKGKGTIVSIKF